jgi:uncharacterized secreted protein with C-terminal beta-propeller domain
MQKDIKKRAKAYGLAAILLAIVLGTACYSLGILPIDYQPLSPTPSSTQLKTFASMDELRNRLLTTSEAQGPFYSPSPWDTRVFSSTEMNAMQTEGLVKSSPGFTFQSSTTNVQVADVDEADIIKNQEGYIYAVSNNSIVIMEAYPPEDARIVSRITFNGTYPIEIFINGERLAVIGYQYTRSLNSNWYSYFGNVKTTIRVYDISDKSDPSLMTSFTVSGNYFNSRRIGDYVYLVANQPAYVIYDTAILPKIYTADGINEISPSEIYYFNASDSYYTYATFIALNMQNIEEEPNHMTLMLGGTSDMYVSLNNMYVTFQDFKSQTSIYRIRIQGRNMTGEAQGKVPGRTINQFSMDEYNNYFRIATAATWTSWTPASNLYILDMNLTIVGKLENFAPNETLDSARFIGNRCYLSTSVVRRDPFFVIDVENTTSPRILGWLKIPGFTRYLHPFDADHIIGVGMNGSNVKISLYDVSNVSAPETLSEYKVSGDYSYSDVLDDHKAFLFDYDKHLLAIPIETSDYYRSYWWQGLYVFDISISSGLDVKGTITHQEPGSYTWDTSYHVKRSLYIENVLYTMSDKKIKLNDLENLAPLKEIPLS